MGVWRDMEMVRAKQRGCAASVSNRYAQSSRNVSQTSEVIVRRTTRISKHK